MSTALPVRPGAVRTDLALLAGAVGLVGACVLSPTMAADGPVVCPVRALTGLPCPACGSVRAWTAFAHGDLGGAVAHNPFAVGLLLATWSLLVWRLAAIATATRGPDVERLLRTPVALGVLVAWVAWGIGRAAGGW